MNDFDKKLDFDSDTFENMKHDMNFVLQRLLGNMIEKQSNEGSMTIKIDVTMVKEFIPNYDPNIKGESREISKPQFKHKVTSAVKITDEKGGNLNNEMEMVMDEETGCYVLQPIANTQQRTIFDSDFMQGQKQEGEGNEDIIDGTYIDADVRPALPGPADEEKPAETEKTDTHSASLLSGRFLNSLNLLQGRFAYALLHTSRQFLCSWVVLLDFICQVAQD